MFKRTSDQGKKEGPNPLATRAATLLTPVLTGAQAGSSVKYTRTLPSLLFLCELHSAFSQDSPHSTYVHTQCLLTGGVERGQKTVTLLMVALRDFCV